MVRRTLTRTIALAAIAGAGLVGLAGCEGRADVTGRLLEVAPADAEVVIAIEPARIAGTWADEAIAALAEGVVPTCVIDAARGSAAVVVAWAPDSGLMIAVAGPRKGDGCPELVRRRGDRVWSGGLEPATDRTTGPSTTGDRFFAARERRRRWSDLADAPVRGIADLDVSAGMTVHARGTVDPRDGLDARIAFAADDRATLLSLRDAYLRWRGGLDRERLGAAWPAIEAMTTIEDRNDPDRRTDILEVKLPGADAGEAAAMALIALTSGLGGSAPRLPCPDSLGDYTGRAACQDGEVTMTDGLWDELADDPSVLTDDVRIVPSLRNGAFAGFRVEALSSTDPLTWLGLENGDVVDAIDGEALTGADQVLAASGRIRAARDVEIGITRRGRHGTLRYRAR